MTKKIYVSVNFSFFPHCASIVLIFSFRQSALWCQTREIHFQKHISWNEVFKNFLQFVLLNLKECIFVSRIVIDFLYSKLRDFPLFLGGKIQSSLPYKKSMTILKTKIHSVRLNKTDSNCFHEILIFFRRKEINYIKWMTSGIHTYLPTIENWKTHGCKSKKL